MSPQGHKCPQDSRRHACFHPRAAVSRTMPVRIKISRESRVIFRRAEEPWLIVA